MLWYRSCIKWCIILVFGIDAIYSVVVGGAQQHKFRKFYISTIEHNFSIQQVTAIACPRPKRNEIDFLHSPQHTKYSLQFCFRN